ncbi:hypothetical protein LHFGNBLO_006151 (plasmid) [Mesorhizobium sp. AR10]|uniref:hypothetical protein n=1 Tax=Mesorhizobium sp. AR10 TaxID=2865839 RepID=UPI00215FA88F|nr:hypothetical protein [Mesorhizobium sp. AR10]UVK36057.1 hypothetical protein LHFGNBLO_006151 [Mesorhizobium sp. AR10]
MNLFWTASKMKSARLKVTSSRWLLSHTGICGAMFWSTSHPRNLPVPYPRGALRRKSTLGELPFWPFPAGHTRQAPRAEIV